MTSKSGMTTFDPFCNKPYDSHNLKCVRKRVCVCLYDQGVMDVTLLMQPFIYNALAPSLSFTLLLSLSCINTGTRLHVCLSLPAESAQPVDF